MQKKFIKIIAPIILLIVLISLFILIKNIYDKRKMAQKEIYEVEDRTKMIEDNQKHNTDLYEVNAWIKVQGTNIDIPVIGYIRHNTENEKIKIDNYAWQPDNHHELVNKETIIGHNILNLSAQPMIGSKYFKSFEDLMSFVYYDFAKDNKYVQYTIDGKNYTYKIFSVFFDDTVKMINDQHNTDISKKEMKKVINRYKKSSYFKYDVDVDENDKIITLNTCTRFYGVSNYKTFVVNARLLRENEKMTDYNVKVKDNYKIIKKMIEEKGEEENEEI